MLSLNRVIFLPVMNYLFFYCNKLKNRWASSYFPQPLIKKLGLRIKKKSKAATGALHEAIFLKTKLKNEYIHLKYLFSNYFDLQ